MHGFCRLHVLQNCKTLRFLFRLYNYHLSKDKELAQKLQTLLGYTPVNLHVFKLAFSHKSTNTEKSQSQQNNERLEYLGDAVLGAIVAEYLFKKYPLGDEGFLTKMRSKIVKRKELNRIGKDMRLDDMLNDYNTTRLSNSMLGNALEALVGAVYLDGGYEHTRKFVIQRILRREVNIQDLETRDDNYKSQLLEWCQKNGKTVSYKLMARYKYEKRDRFKVAVMINNNKVAIGDDFNKKSAEQMASERALIQLGILSEDEDD
jgi:ribonuclease III